MSDPAQRWHDNVPGKWYVDASCIDCDLCNEIAPRFFKGNDAEAHSFVCGQPETPEDLVACEEAQSSCPVEAIGSDGDVARDV